MSLASGTRIAERTTFPGGSVLEYAITAAAIAKPRASFANGIIEVAIPHEEARTWARSDRVGIEAEDSGLRILVEKDFACLKPRGEEEDHDAFPNPNPTC